MSVHGSERIGRSTGVRRRPRATGSDESSRERPLRREEKIRLAVLGLPTLALALSVTLVTTYLGRIVRSYTHDTIVIGAIIAGEGLMALWVPLIAGPWSDRLRTRLGGRLPFVIAGAVPAAAALAMIGFVHSLGAVALTAEIFFIGYFVAYEPYRALYPDLLADAAVAGRSQSAQAVARGSGTGIALLGGGLLLSLGRAVPFVFGAVLLAGALAAFTVLLVRRGLSESQDAKRSEGVIATARELVEMVRGSSALRSYLLANAMWEGTLASLKAFVILYLTVGLGYSLSIASLLIGGVALVILLGAAAAGKAGDRFGRLRVVRIAVIAYGAGYLVLVFTTSRPVIAAAMPFVAIGGGALMTLAYAILMPLMPERQHGALTGFYSFSRGVGIMFGTILAGCLIELTRNGVFSSTQGFAAMWVVCSALALGSVPLIGRLRAEKDGSGEKGRADTR